MKVSNVGQDKLRALCQSASKLWGESDFSSGSAESVSHISRLGKKQEKWQWIPNKIGYTKAFVIFW